MFALGLLAPGPISADIETTLSHYFYRDLATADASMSYSESLRSTAFGYTLAFHAKNDQVLDREDVDLALETFSAFALTRRDTVRVDFGYGRYAERKRGDEIGQRDGFAGFELRIHPLNGELLSRVRGRATDYFRGSEDLDNSGVQTEHRYSVDLGALSMLAGMSAGRWRLTEETAGLAEIGYQIPNGEIIALLEADRTHYPVPAGRERRTRRSARVTGTILLPLGPLGVEVHTSVSRNDRTYGLNRLKNGTRDRGEIGGALSARFGGWTLGSSLGLGLENSDFRTYAGDERTNTNRAALSCRFDFGRGHHIELEGTVDMERFTYPEEVRQDDRDKRDAELKLDIGFLLDGNTALDLAFGAVRRDLVYLRATRSINTSKNEHFTLLAEVEHSSTLEFTQRAEITALYSTFSNERERNQIIRYLQSMTRLGYPEGEPRIIASYLYRTQDRGSYVLDRGDWVYLRSVITYENTLSGTFIPLRPMGFALGMEGSWYSRHQRTRGEVNLVASETVAGVSISRGSFLFAYRVHNRHHEDVFYSVDLTLNTMF
jgi:hypothetical protein